MMGSTLHHPHIAEYLELSIRKLDLPRDLGQHSGGNDHRTGTALLR